MPNSPAPRASHNLSPSSGHYRWLICILLFFATTINYVDRQILSLIKPILDDKIGWTNEQFGWVNSSFQAAYAISLLGFGWLIDRYGTKIGYAVSIASWSVAAMAHAAVHSLSGFFGVRVFLGLGEGGNFPAAIKAVATWFPKRERALATSLFNSGCNVGAMLAPAIVPWLALTYGWQSPFIIAGLAGFVWLLFWIPLYGNPSNSKRVNAGEQAWITQDEAAAGAPADTAKIPWKSLLRYRQTWGYIAARFLTDPVWWFFLIWLPDYFKKTRHLDIKNSWVHLVTIYAIVTVLSIFGGWVTGHLTGRGWTVTRARKTCMLIFAFAVVPIAFATHCGDWTAVVVIGLAGAAHQAWSANLFSTVSDMFPNRAVASMVGLGGMAGSVGGILFPVVSGRLLDHFQAAGNITLGYGMLFGFCSGAYVLAFIINHLLTPRFESVKLIEN